MKGRFISIDRHLTVICIFEQNIRKNKLTETGGRCLCLWLSLCAASFTLSHIFFLKVIIIALVVVVVGGRGATRG